MTTATVEHTFSSMELIKTKLPSRMGEDTLEHIMCICIESLTTCSMEAVVDHHKGVKKRRLAITTSYLPMKISGLS